MKKKILLGVLFAIAVVGTFLIGFMFKDTSQYNLALQEESIIVSINPEVLFNTDNKGYVKEVLHINEDAKIYKEEDFIGLEIKEAVDKSIAVAKENGYVKEDTVVNVSSLSENSVYVEDIVLNLKGNKINVKTKKISKDAIETIMSNIDTTGNVETEFIVLDDGYVIIKKHSNIEGPGPSEEELNNQTDNNNTNNNTDNDKQNTKPVQKDEEPTTEKDLGGGYVKVEPAGYGDYIKGDHVYLYEGGPRYFKFYETSKIGCKDAIDKKACANWYINDLTPRLASVKDNLETWQNQYDAEVRRLEEAQKKVTELEDEILNYNPEDNYTPLEDLKTSLEHYKTVVEGATSGKKEAQDYVKAINLEIEEYNKVLAVYYAVLN